MLKPKLVGEDVSGMSDIETIRQREDWDCGIACLAMVTGQTYEQVVAAFPETVRVNNSVAQPQIEAYLTVHTDLFWRRVYSQNALGIAGIWPPEPFADIHICIVQQPSGNGHFVVMLSDGTVLDPLADERKRLTDWAVVNCVIGLRGFTNRYLEARLADVEETAAILRAKDADSQAREEELRYERDAAVTALEHRFRDMEELRAALKAFVQTRRGFAVQIAGAHSFYSLQIRPELFEQAEAALTPSLAEPETP